MLIRFDALLSQPHHQSNDINELLSGKFGPPPAAYTMAQLRQRDSAKRGSLKT